MPLTLEQYATYLDTRGLPWPAPPEVKRPRARPTLVRLADEFVVLRRLARQRVVRFRLVAPLAGLRHAAPPLDR